MRRTNDAIPDATIVGEVLQFHCETHTKAFALLCLIHDTADQRDRLLEALRDMVSDHADLSTATLEFARAAIAEAEGKP